MTKRRGVQLISTAMAVPEQIMPNSYFDEQLGEDVSTWLEENVEIFERRWCAEDQSTVDLCETAAQRVLKKAGCGPEDIDLIIVSTDTPEFVSPSTASVLQDRLQARNAGTFDLNTACAGFVTALDTGAKYIQADEQYHRVLVIGAYAMSKHLNKKDKKTVTLFADGAGAVLLQHAEENRYTPGELLTRGEYCEWMGIYAGGTRYPVTHERIDRHEHQLQFVKKFPKELNPQMWSQMILNLAEKMKIDVDEFDHFFLTQININAIRETMDILKVSKERAHTIMHNFGYTGSACIPMALAEADRKGLLKSGDLCCFVGSGGGLAFASAGIRL